MHGGPAGFQTAPPPPHVPAPQAPGPALGAKSRVGSEAWGPSRDVHTRPQGSVWTFHNLEWAPRLPVPLNTHVPVGLDVPTGTVAAAQGGSGRRFTRCPCR